MRVQRVLVEDKKIAYLMVETHLLLDGVAVNRPQNILCQYPGSEATFAWVLVQNTFNRSSLRTFWITTSLQNVERYLC